MSIHLDVCVRFNYLLSTSWCTSSTARYFQITRKTNGTVFAMALFAQICQHLSKRSYIFLKCDKFRSVAMLFIHFLYLTTKNNSHAKRLRILNLNILQYKDKLKIIPCQFNILCKYYCVLFCEFQHNTRGTSLKKLTLPLSHFGTLVKSIY